MKIWKTNVRLVQAVRRFRRSYSVEFKKLTISEGRKCGQGQNRTADTRIFSPERVPGQCVTIGLQRNEFQRLKSVRSGSIFRLEHTGANSSGKVVAKCQIRGGKIPTCRASASYFFA
jgi:UDP-N-acetylenolpyruvoylglucosamine reductase